ncbi:MAG: peptidoglycan-associated lipoprotein Pal [Alphaproteobacteria bacterium]
MRIKFVSLFAALLLVAACETAPEETASTAGEGGATAAQAESGISTAPATAQPSAEVSPVAGPTPGTQEDLVLNVGDRVFFDFDKAVLKPAAQRTLERQATWLKQYSSVTITIEGHCDERGTREYNLALGERRATAAKNFLVALGVNPSRVSTISYGKERPAALGHNEAAWSQNRRAVTVVN